MSTDPDNDSFYIGYLPKAPTPLARFTRKIVLTFFLGALAAAGVFAFALPYFGMGKFDFGNAREFSGTIRCEMAPRLSSAGVDYLLVGYGKNGVTPEICGATGNEATLRGTLIQREGRQLIEVSSPARANDNMTTPPPIPVPLGYFTLTGEIVDSKCYFGVMNPAEGRAHRACAVQCLRGGVPAVFVARDRSGAVAHLLITRLDGKPMNETLLRWVGEGVEVSGNVARVGQWLVLQVEASSIHFAQTK